MGGGSGGGSNGVKYDNLEKLYEEQTENAKMLREISAKYLPGQMAAYMGSVEKVNDPNYATEQANIAAADMASVNGMERQATERELASMGVNANDPRFQKNVRAGEIANAGRMAAGVNSTRDAAERYKLAVNQDAVGTMTGTNNSAASQMGAATSGLSSLYTNQQQLQANQQAQQSANVANAVGGAYSLLMSKEGGTVPGLQCLAGGGLAQGGLTGGAAFTPLAAPVSAPSAPATQDNSVKQLVSVGKIGKGLVGGEGNIFTNFANKMQSQGAGIMDNFAKGADFFGADQTAAEMRDYAANMRLSPDQTKAAKEAYTSAAEQAKSSGDLAAAQEYSSAADSLGSGITAPGSAPAAGMDGALGSGISVPGAEAGVEAAAGMEGALGAGVTEGAGAAAAGAAEGAAVAGAAEGAGR
jgi:hypothetical protein